ncbi:hypothetical protein MC7420_3982 [Coleofasciculus chthonoplastes PCC 7420]|uniref:Uncharacterized protein n=1 Tax=Coleofasciculus chthonoplastes PCC 7420 TaxID=118168 RepID=B4VUG6_9CYAN|nr:hypothetical protein MC7420_3982 [Coleofasciculus chthonoplastes PCC 7420]
MSCATPLDLPKFGVAHSLGSVLQPRANGSTGAKRQCHLTI